MISSSLFLMIRISLGASKNEKVGKRLNAVSKGSYKRKHEKVGNWIKKETIVYQKKKKETI